MGIVCERTQRGNMGNMNGVDHDIMYDLNVELLIEPQGFTRNFIKGVCSGIGSVFDLICAKGFDGNQTIERSSRRTKRRE